MLYLFIHERNVSSTQVEMLSQMLSVKDQKFRSISLKNDELSENLENVMSDLSEAESQLKEQRQQEVQHQQQDVESCKKVRNSYQTWDDRCQGSEHYVHFQTFQRSCCSCDIYKWKTVL